MEAKPISVTDHTMFVVKTRADLNLQGWDKLEVRALADDRHGLNVFQEGDIVRIQSSSDLDITIPAGASITVERASGDAHIRNLTGHLMVQRVGGDLAAQNVASAEIMSVGGDCTVNIAQGALAIQRIGGDFAGSQLSGPVNLDGIGGDANLQIEGGEVRLRTGGDINLQVLSTVGLSLRADAGGDVVLGLPDEAGAALDLRSRGHDIKIEYGGETQKIEKRLFQGSIGDGSARINIDAGGDIRISGDPTALQDFHELEDDLEEHWSQLEEKRSKHSGEADTAFSFRADEFNERISRRVDEAMRQADSRINEAMKRLDQRTRRMERHGSSMPFTAGPSATPGPARKSVFPESNVEKKPSVSDEEKALILKMLQEKRITAEEAEKLLEALEG